MQYFVSQPIGAGDIIFTQTLVREIAKDNPVTWATEKYYLDAFNRAYPNIKFVDKSTINQVLLNEKGIGMKQGYYVLPIRWSDTIMKVPYKQVMRAKYDMFNLDWKIWKRDAYPARDLKKEKILYKELGLKKNEPYNFINKNYLRNGNGVAQIEVINGMKNIHMNYKEGYSLFDWCYLIENATYIHSVSTSVLFLLEILDLKAKEVHLYSRKPYENGFSFVDYLFSKNYILHD